VVRPGRGGTLRGHHPAPAPALCPGRPGGGAHRGGGPPPPGGQPARLGARRAAAGGGLLARRPGGRPAAGRPGRHPPGGFHRNHPLCPERAPATGARQHHQDRHRAPGGGAGRPGRAGPGEPPGGRHPGVQRPPPGGPDPLPAGPAPRHDAPLGERRGRRGGGTPGRVRPRLRPADEPAGSRARRPQQPLPEPPRAGRGRPLQHRLRSGAHHPDGHDLPGLRPDRPHPGAPDGRGPLEQHQPSPLELRGDGGASRRGPPATPAIAW